MVAYAMNGETLPLQHGYPVRLVVPSWYSPCLLAAEFALVLSRLRDA
jgi:hypothetical protein